MSDPIRNDLELADSNPKTNPFAGVRILYVDDSKTFLVLMERLLKNLGAEFLGISQPQAALASASGFNPDLIITDYEMEEINGVELVKLFRLNPNFQGVPIVLLTATQDVQICIKAIESGADDFVAKEDLTKILLPKISALLRVRQNNLKLLRLLELETVNTTVTTYKHEFNNALSILDGRMLVLQRALDDDKYSEHFTKINECVSRMKEVLRSLENIKEVKTEIYHKTSKILKLK